MFTASFLYSLTRHLPLFSSMYEITSPFVTGALPLFPNKIKFLSNADITDMKKVLPGLYYYIPTNLNNTEFSILESSILDGLADYDLLGRLSLRPCKPFAHKFIGIQTANKVFNSFNVKQGRLYIKSIDCYIGKGYVLPIADFPTFITHLLNFLVVGMQLDYKSPFFGHILNANVKEINSALVHTDSNLKPNYGKCKSTGSPTLTFKTDKFTLEFNLQDKDFITEFILPILFAFFDSDTNLTKYLHFRV